MKYDKESFKEKFAQKGIYLTVAAGFLILIVSVVVSYYTTGRLPEEPGNVTTITSAESDTRWAQAEKTDVEDTRDELRTTASTEDGSMQENTTHEQMTAEETTHGAVKETVQSSAKETQATQTSAPSKQQFSYPTSGKIIKSFSADKLLFSKTMGDWRTHRGTDFEMSEGDKVYSIGNGQVKRVTSEVKWGYCIEVDYGEFTARYCGINQENAVSVGQQVYKNTVIGTVSTSPCEELDGTHLHLEIIKDGKYIDPITVME